MNPNIPSIRTEASVWEAVAHLYLAAIPSILVGLDAEGTVRLWNRRAAQVFGLESAEVLGTRIADAGSGWAAVEVSDAFRRCLASRQPQHVEDLPYTRPDDTHGILGVTINPVFDECGHLAGCLLFGADITERKAAQAHLAHAQKMESVGQLAAGIAHEINTPTQFVGDNTRFLRDAFGDLLALIEEYERLYAAVRNGSVTDDLLQALDATRRATDVEYLSDEIPTAIEQSLAGLERVANIVRAMKEFSHPGSEDLAYIDINRNLESTLTISRNEWKYVAEVETDFAEDLPAIPCYPGDLNQVFLNIIVNAAHAIGDVVGDGSERKGKIRICTRKAGEYVEVRIADTGAGIPPEAANRVFDPFFTTKRVGKGTGQGLTIAHRIVTERHGGTITFETTQGEGTTFIVRLPIELPVESREEACA